MKNGEKPEKKKTQTKEILRTKTECKKKAGGGGTEEKNRWGGGGGVD